MPRSIRTVIELLDKGVVTPYREAERLYIIAVLNHTQWKIKGKEGAAELLKINPSTLYSKIKKLDIKLSR